VIHASHERPLKEDLERERERRENSTAVLFSVALVDFCENEWPRLALQRSGLNVL
jgi:hypothetical protein